MIDNGADVLDDAPPHLDPAIGTAPNTPEGPDMNIPDEDIDTVAYRPWASVPDDVTADNREVDGNEPIAVRYTVAFTDAATNGNGNGGVGYSELPSYGSSQGDHSDTDGSRDDTTARVVPNTVHTDDYNSKPVLDKGEMVAVEGGRDKLTVSTL